MVDITFPAATDDFVLLLLRLILGFSFLVAARNKAKNIGKFAKNNDIPVPMALVVMVVEFSAGLLLLAGVETQLAALSLAVLMLGTISMHIFKWKSPYWASKGGWEYDLMLLAMASVIAVFGAGDFALMK